MSPQEWQLLTGLAEKCKSFVEKGTGILVVGTNSGLISLVTSMRVQGDYIVFNCESLDCDDIIINRNQEYGICAKKMNSITAIKGKPQSLNDIFSEEW